MLRAVKRPALLAVVAALLVAGCNDETKQSRSTTQAKPAAPAPAQEEPKPGPAQTFVSRPDLRPPKIQQHAPQK